MTAGEGDPLNLAGRVLPNITARTVVLPGCSSQDFDEDRWLGALVVVRSGTIVLETIGGACRGFGPGDILYLTGLRIRRLSNPDPADAVLQVISRQPRHG